ncbi:hypothetical protein HGRIS_012892 [Hohenbuehelia grisea]|uniref:GPI mannosyltransferase 1 n=1 Tax=Hohenbuehelia grisea TaxID=104357 RepID=A0ABR3ITQ2_9AGAR
MPSSDFCTSRVPSITVILAGSVLLRVALIIYSEWHDAHSVVKYTDVDYRVFSDATHFLLNSGPSNQAQGPLAYKVSLGDPYTRETYRYTPLLALLLAPNEWLHPSFGKYLFAVCDIINGILIYRILLSFILPSTPPHIQNASKVPQGQPTTVEKASLSRASLLAGLHLLNPLIFTISTRGSSESVLATFVLATLDAAMREKWDAAAVWLGISVHWKIYPVIYGLTCLRAMSHNSSFLSWKSVRFSVLSAGTFFALGGICYLIWGMPFLAESYLYHLHRLDHRHNFSPYFYLTYLTYPSSNPGLDTTPALWSSALRSPLVSFAPQMLLSLGTGLLFGVTSRDLPFAWFVQTTIFVLFNKVCTSQYFLWYLVLLPLILPQIRLTTLKAIACLLVWICTQALWLAEAYQLEFLGENVYLGLWARSLVYVLGNGWVLASIMKHYNVNSL